MDLAVDPLCEALALARMDLAAWEDQARTKAVRLGGIDAPDPRVQWNLGFHKRRVAALERALKEATRHMNAGSFPELS